MARYFDEEEPELEERSQDTEVTLSWGAVAGMGVALLAICGLCFGLGYMVGHRGSGNRSSGPAASTAAQGAPDQEPLQGSGAVAKPSASAQAPTPSPTQANDNTPPAGDGGASPEATAPSTPATTQSGPTGAPAVTTPVQPPIRPVMPGNTQVNSPAAALMVQVAAVRNVEDAGVLANALRRRGYPVNAQRDPGDGLIHVRVGPFATRDEANRWRDKLLGDGYNAMVQP